MHIIGNRIDEVPVNAWLYVVRGVVFHLSQYWVGFNMDVCSSVNLKDTFFSLNLELQQTKFLTISIILWLKLLKLRLFLYGLNYSQRMLDFILAGWSPHNLGKILWGSTRYYICNWCCMPFTLWRLKVSFGLVILTCQFHGMFILQYCIWFKISYWHLYTTNLSLLWCWTYTSNLRIRESTSARGFTRSPTFDTCKQAGLLLNSFCCFLTKIRFSLLI